MALKKSKSRIRLFFGQHFCFMEKRKKKVSFCIFTTGKRTHANNEYIFFFTFFLTKDWNFEFFSQKLGRNPIKFFLSRLTYQRRLNE